MNCTICSITNKELKDAVEKKLIVNDGMLSENDKVELRSLFPGETDLINKITDEDCDIHFNFHITEMRSPVIRNTPAADGKKKSNSLAEDVGKDEAEILYEMANKEMITFNLATKRINEALQNVENETSAQIIHPTTIQLYREIKDSIRATVNAIKDLNASVNGAADSALEGLKALAGAISGSRAKAGLKEGEAIPPQDTKEFD